MLRLRKTLADNLQDIGVSMPNAEELELRQFLESKSLIVQTV
jgi:hypothetical protein